MDLDPAAIFGATPHLPRKYQSEQDKLYPQHLKTQQIPPPNSTLLHSPRKMTTRKGPFRLVTVNTAPERAKRLIGRLITELQDDYEIIHVDNCSSTLPPDYLCHVADSV